MSYEAGALNTTAAPPVAVTTESFSQAPNGQGVASPEVAWSPYGQVMPDGSVSNPDGGFEIGPSTPVYQPEASTNTQVSQQQAQVSQQSQSGQQAEGTEQDAQNADAPLEGDEADIVPDEAGRIPYQRFQSVIGERNTLRTQYAETTAKLEKALPFLPFIEAGMLDEILALADSPQALQERLTEDRAKQAFDSVTAQAEQAVAAIDADIATIDDAEAQGTVDVELAATLRSRLYSQRQGLIDTYTKQRDLAVNQARYEPYAQKAQAQSQQAAIENTITALKQTYPNLDEHSVRRELTLPGGQADAMARAQAEAQRTHTRYVPAPTAPTAAQLQAQQAQQRNQIAATRQAQAPQVPTTSTNGGGGALPQAQSIDELNQQRQAAGLPPLNLRRG